MRKIMTDAHWMQGPGDSRNYIFYKHKKKKPNTFIKCTLCERHFLKHFTYLISFNPHKNFVQ